MTVSQKLQILEKKAEDLSVLAEYLKNPSLMQELRQDIKDTYAFSESERLKAEEAKRIIADSEATQKDLSEREVILSQKQEAHEKFVKESFNRIETEKENLFKMKAALDARTIEQAETDEKHAKDRANILDVKNNFAAQSTKDKASIVIAIDTIERDKKANESEAARLSEWREKLTKKSTQLREATSDL